MPQASRPSRFRLVPVHLVKASEWQPGRDAPGCPVSCPRVWLRTLQSREASSVASNACTDLTLVSCMAGPAGERGFRPACGLVRRVGARARCGLINPGPRRRILAVSVLEAAYRAKPCRPGREGSSRRASQRPSPLVSWATVDGLLQRLAVFGTSEGRSPRVSQGVLGREPP